MLVDGAQLEEVPAEGAGRGALLSYRGHLTEGGHTAVLEFTADPEAPARGSGLWITALPVQPD